MKKNGAPELKKRMPQRNRLYELRNAVLVVSLVSIQRTVVRISDLTTAAFVNISISLTKGLDCRPLKQS